MDDRIAPPQFLTADVAAEVRERFGTPCYVYDRAALEAAARAALAFPAPFGFTLRYAMKANPSRGILQVFRALGLHIDASSDFEVERALEAGFEPGEIQLTSQMPSRRLAEHVRRGVLFNACSAPPARQLRAGRSRERGVGPDEPRPRHRLHQAHQHRRAGVELRDLARVPRRGQDDRRAPPACESRGSTPTWARAPTPRSGSAAPG